jgi:hypothetical protein
MSTSIQAGGGGRTRKRRQTPGRGRRSNLTDNPRHLTETEAVNRCGARTRSGAPCKSAPVTGRRRCRMHGGADGSGAPKRGKEWQLQARPLYQGDGCHPSVATRGHSYAPRAEQGQRMTIETTRAQHGLGGALTACFHCPKRAVYHGPIVLETVKP